MNEGGVRVKFRAVELDTRPIRRPGMKVLARWCAAFDRHGLAPVEDGASAGNLSFRVLGGFVITATRTRLKRAIPWHSFVDVSWWDWGRWSIGYMGGAPPSSDSFLHAAIYEKRPDVGAVFHGHDPVILKAAPRLARQWPIAFTPRERLFGTRVDARETARALGARDYLIRKGHGFVAVGRTPDEAGELALEMRRRALRLT